MEKWDYLSVELEQKTEGKGFTAKKIWDAQYFSEQLKNYGQQGWELISCFPVSEQAGSGSGRTSRVFAMFKRKMQS